jgi:6-phospho-3-hexuloisomerase
MEMRFREILNEIELALEKSDLEKCDAFIDSIINSRTIITYGAGRVGLAMRSFSKRLRHLGFNSYFLEDSSVPATNSKDLLILGTGSGSTPSVRVIAEVAVKNNLNIHTITATPSSVVASMSSNIIYLNTPSKEAPGNKNTSIQPMTTLFEQTLGIFLDSIVLEIMNTLGENEITMKERHNVLE